MRYQTMWRQAAAAGGRAGIVAIVLSAAMLLPAPLAHAADQPSAAAELPPAGSGPLTPVHRDPPAVGERPATKPPATAKAPVAPKPAAATAPAAANSPPSPNKPETSTPKPPRSTAATKPAAPASGQAEKKAAAASAQAEKKPAPADRTAERDRRHRYAAPETVQRRPIYRDYAYQAPGWGYAPPPDYGEAPVDVGPGPYAPSWYYRERPLADGPYAYGPYSGMRAPRPMPW